jgi:ribonuclease E
MAPSSSFSQLSTVTAFARESFVHGDESIADALAPNTARRQAYDAALAEIMSGRSVPSIEWRRQYALMLGLERLLNCPAPALVDGTTLNDHQVDALSGTLVELLREAQTPTVVPDLSSELSSKTADPCPDDEGSFDSDECDDPNAARRFWFEHATGAGKTIAALGFVDACRTGGVLILTHRRNLVEQFIAELNDHGYGDRLSKPMIGDVDHPGVVTVETYQWFVRHAGTISRSYAMVICDEAHTALGERTSAAIRAWTGPVWIGMTATGALIARHVTDVFPTQTSRFDLAQAARQGVISPLRCLRVPPGDNVHTIAKVPLRKGEIDIEFDQQALAELLDQTPFNLAAAHFYQATFTDLPGVVYAAGVRHANHLAAAFQQIGIAAVAVSGETPKRQLSETLAAYERGELQVLVNAQLLAEGWNSPRATVCLHLAPTASRRVYQQRVGRVTRRSPGKEAGIVVDFVRAGARHDEPVITLHSLLGRDFYREGAVVVGPVRSHTQRRVNVGSMITPISDNLNRRAETIDRELWRINVSTLDQSDQRYWAQLVGRRADIQRYQAIPALDEDIIEQLATHALEYNSTAVIRQQALIQLLSVGSAAAIEHAFNLLANADSSEQCSASRAAFEALTCRPQRFGAEEWVWQLAELTRGAHERYALARWSESKRLLGQVVNSTGGTHVRAVQRLITTAQAQDHRLHTALLGAALVYTPEAGQLLKTARQQLSAQQFEQVCRDLMKDLPKPGRRRRTKANAGGPNTAKKSGPKSSSKHLPTSIRQPAAETR